jgi:hypothetical protein
LGTKGAPGKSSLFVLAAAGQGGLNSRGGRPCGPNPWRDRKAGYKREYMRAYMRGWRARKKGEGNGQAKSDV